jgi:hypothetical protein
MSGIDLIVAAPWIIFAAGLVTICIFLLRSRRAAGPDRPEPARWLHLKERKCPQKNTKARRP